MNDAEMKRIGSRFARQRARWRAAAALSLLVASLAARGVRAEPPAPELTGPAPAPAASALDDSRPGPEAGDAGARQHLALELEQSLEDLDRLASLPVIAASIGSVVLGGLTAAYGVAVAVDGDELGQTTGRATLSGVALSAGFVMFVRGLHGLVGRPSTDRERLLRWRRAAAHGVPDDLTLARFEGELAAEAELARVARLTGAISGIGVAAAGATLAGFGAGSTLRGKAETTAYAFGTALFVIGAFEALSQLLAVSPHERIWQRYEGVKLASTSTLLRVGVAPTLDRRNFGLALHAEF